MTLPRKLALCAGLVLNATCLPAGARAAQTVTLQAGFDPDRLGVRTTIEFGFQVTSTIAGQAPSPVTDVDLHLPAGMGLYTSTLGLAGCQPAALLARGVAGCSPNARLGYGSAIVAVPAEPEPIQEEGSLTALAGPPNSEHLEVLFYAEGHSPVFAQLVFPGRVLNDSRPFGGRLNTAIPLIPTWPGGPDVAVTHMSSTIGPNGLTYYRRAHGRTVPFHPRGVAVPRSCPPGGFPFRVDVAFLDGSRATATVAVPCPP